MNLIQTTDLTLSHGKAVTINFPALSLRPSESLLLLGPSGSGKTSLLSSLAGLLRPTSGQVLIKGQDFYSLPPRERDLFRGKHFGFVFQTLHLLPFLSVEKNIILSAEMAGLDVNKERLESLLKSLGLSDKADRKPHELSQGEQQRAALARAVFHAPPILIADEPTSALDDENAAIVMSLLESQCRESGTALIVATHDNRIKDRFSNILTLTQKQVAA